MSERHPEKWVKLGHFQHRVVAEGLGQLTQDGYKVSQLSHVELPIKPGGGY